MEEFIITVVRTKNPAILKFESNHPLTGGNHEYRHIDEAGNSPLARQLFYLPFIKTVYISGNFIAMERFDIVAWDDVKDEVAQQLVEYLNAGGPVVDDSPPQKQAVTLYAEVTPNPAVMKFVANIRLVPVSFEFKRKEDATVSELAKLLFRQPYVRELFMDENYVSVTKDSATDWEEVTAELRVMIRDFIAGNNELVSPEAIARKTAQDSETQSVYRQLDDTSRQIMTILEEYVKPAVASDGGNIIFQSYEQDSKKVNVILQGACSGCPSSTYTLKNGIENMLKNMLGDKVSEVIAING